MPNAGGAPSWTTVENLVEQRSRSFEYLKRVQQGDTHWLSTVALGATRATAAPMTYSTTEGTPVESHFWQPVSRR